MVGRLAQTSSFPLVAAHRGFRELSGAADNSMQAFRDAVALRVDALELDIHRTRDGVLVVHHDPEYAGIVIADTDFAHLPRLHDGQPIARLDEVADLARQSGVRVAAELKESGYEQQVVRELSARMPASQLELISFNRGSIEAIEQRDPSLRTGLLEPGLPAWLRNSAAYPAALWVMDKLDWHPAANNAAKLGADYVSVEHRMATPEFIAAAHDRGLQVHAWTVNDASRMRELMRDGVDAIVTDRPDVALALRTSLPAAPSLPLAA